VKNCSYCGRESDEARGICCECGTPVVSPELVKKRRSASPANKILVWLRRSLSAVIGLILLGIVAPEFGFMPRIHIFFSIVAPLIPVLFVWHGAGREPAVEAIGWFLLFFGTVLIFSA
jgi:hypothetical protein